MLIVLLFAHCNANTKGYNFLRTNPISGFCILLASGYKLKLVHLKLVLLRSLVSVHSFVRSS